MVKATRETKSIVASSIFESEMVSVSEQQCQELNWRMCPNESLSDWTIKILVGGKLHGCYHVHKALIAVGPKKSEYFARLFQNEVLDEHNASTSSIKLEELAAEAFPAMLDYQYSRDDELPVTDENATALCFLGQYFGIRRLCVKAEQFWTNSLDATNCAVYYHHALVFHDEKVTQAVIEKCCEQLDWITEDSPLIEVSDDHLWIEVSKLRRGKPSPHLSNLILSFCSLHSKSLDRETFQSLTEESLLPVVSFEAAVPLLELEKSIIPLDDGVELSSLQKRCVTALATSWKFLNTPGIQKALIKLHPLVSSYALTQAVENAKAELLKAGESILPEAILVSGAGSEEVNGMYVRTECYGSNGAPRFVMAGKWHGKAVRFDLCLCRMLSEKMSWFITIQDSVAPGTCRDIDFYQVTSSAKGNPKLPPSKGWKAVAQGEGAGPRLEYRFVYGLPVGE